MIVLDLDSTNKNNLDNMIYSDCNWPSNGIQLYPLFTYYIIILHWLEYLCDSLQNYRYAIRKSSCRL